MNLYSLLRPFWRQGKRILKMNEVVENKIIRHYDSSEHFVDLTVDQTIALGLNKWKGWHCAAGVQHIYIGYDGDVYNGNCRVGGKLGNIYSEYQLNQEWIVCTAQFCGCGSDVMTPKVKKPKYKTILKNIDDQGRYAPDKRRESIEEAVAVETAFSPPPHIRVQWDIGRRCNYNCSYCWPDVHSSTEPFKSHELLKKAADSLLDRLDPTKVILFQFGGGEPTIYPKFLELIQYLNSRGHRCVVTSNGSRNEEYYSGLIDVSGVNISVHFESANPQRLIRNIQAMIDRRRKNPFKAGGLEIKIMTPPGALEKAKEFHRMLFEIPDFEKWATWSFVPIRHAVVDKKLAARVVEYSSDELNSIQTRGQPRGAET